MSNINVTIRMDEDLKKEADLLFAEMGFSLSTAFNVFVRQAVREQAIPFEISCRRPNKETIAAFEEVDKMKADSTIGKSYTDVNSMMEELLDDLHN